MSTSPDHGLHGLHGKPRRPAAGNTKEETMASPVVLSRAAAEPSRSANGTWSNNDVWDQAWAGRRKSWHGKVPGQEILCIGCLEQRLGRTLMRCDFIEAPINDPDDGDKSDRLRDRLTAESGTVKDEFSMFCFLAERMIQHLPAHEKARLRASFERDVVGEMRARLVVSNPPPSDNGPSAA
jgi:hypothetical protein